MFVALVAATSSAALARNIPPLRACGQVTTRLPKTGTVKIWSDSKVSARRISCARARGFVRTWERLADEGKLPSAAGGRTNKGVLVFNRWSRPYRASGFVCRSLAFEGPGPVQPEFVSCGARIGLVTWRESGHFGAR